MQNLLKFYI